MIPNKLLQLQALDQRALPTVFTVSNIADSGTGSLRQAVQNANANGGEDTIQFDPVLFATFPGEIELTTGQMTVSDPLIISGPGNLNILVDANFSSRVFNASASLTISDMAFTHGGNAGAPSPGNGGVIYSNSTLNITRCIMSGSATNGGSIHQVGSALTAYDCVFSGNGAKLGGGIYATGAVTLQYCEFDSNTSNISGSAGGGVYLASGSLNIDSCSFRGCGSTNLSIGQGGAVYANGTFMAQNSTFASCGSNQGAAIYLNSGGTLWNCTVAYNNAGSGMGGGIYGDVTLESTIVSNNTAGTGPDIFGAVTAKNCALGKSSGFSSYTDQGGNLALGLNLQLEAGSFYHGGLVPVCSIQATSPARNKGSNPGSASYDARGVGYPRNLDGSPDIGAFEVQPPLTVTVQINDGNAQRSRVTKLSLTFPRDLLGPNTTHWELRRVSDNSLVTLDPIPGSLDPYTITYNFSFSGTNVQNGSLSDGVFRLTVFATTLNDGAGQFLDGNGDGIGGDDYVSPTTVGDPNRIFRLFGDANGDGAVSGSDFNLFRTAFGGSSAMFDFDNDGSVSANDFTQFKMRFGASI